jgi:hypothetical protein
MSLPNWVRRLRPVCAQADLYPGHPRSVILSKIDACVRSGCVCRPRYGMTSNSLPMIRQGARSRCKI